MLNSVAELQTVSQKVAGKRTWIGMHRDSKDKSRWLWVDGSRATFSYWHNGEPNGDNIWEENCVEMYEFSGTWNDAGCILFRYYICEISGKLNNFLVSCL